MGRVNGPSGALSSPHVVHNVHNGTMSTTGYREVSRTMTTQATGQLPSTTREYQIEYLSPANSTTVPEERASSPGVHNSATEYSSGLDRYGNATSSYKTTSYEYKSSSGGSANAALLRDTADTLTQARALTDLGQSNIAELDTLLDDLNSAQRAGFNREYQISTTTSREGYSDPRPAQHISRSSQRSSQRSYSEQRYGSVNKDRQSPSPGPARHLGSSSLDRGVTSSSREVYSSNSRTTSPSPARREIPPSPSASRQVVEHNVYRSYDSRTGGATTTATTRYRDASPPRDRVRPPSPGLPDYPVTGAAKMVTTSTTYNYSSTSGGRPEPPRTPPPHRSPSPVSFPTPPEPLSGYTYRRDETSSYSNSSTRQRSRSRSPPPQPFPVGPAGRSVHTYTVDRVERVHREPVLQPRPFPTPSPTPHEDQRPPKELNELMSSFTETDMSHTSVRQHALDLEQRAQRQQQQQHQPPRGPPTPPPVRKEEQIVSRNVAGPPVYYPPGAETFQQSEMSMSQREGGGAWAKGKGKYEYKMKQRSKESSKTGKALVPVCLPLCCAMPCTIM